MFKLIIKPLAELDATESFKWYEERRQGLGDEFLLTLEAKINEIQRNPFQFQLVHKNVRRALTARFPFALFYLIKEDTVIVLAINHTSRNPNIWKRRK